MGVLDGHIFKRIERHFFLAELIRQAVIDERNRILYGTPNVDNPGGSRAGISNPTEQRGINLADKIKRVEIQHGKQVEIVTRPEEWLEVIDKTYLRFKDSPVSQVMERRYQGELAHDTCKALYIGKTTYYYWQEDIISYAALIAVQKGLIKIF